MMLHLTTHERGESICVEIPIDYRNKFPEGKRVKISLEEDPNIHIWTYVWGTERRFATLLRRSQYADRFGAKVDVRVEAV